MLHKPLADFARAHLRLSAALVILLTALTTTGAAASNTAAAPKPLNGGTVTVNMYQPWIAGNTFQTGVDILPLLLAYEPLVLLDGKTLEPESRIATVTVSPDAKTFTFKLKPNLKWSDGTPFTAADIVFSYKLYANPQISIFSSAFNLVQGINEFRAGTIPTPWGFKAPNKSTFIIQLSQPYAPFLAKLANPTLFLLPQHILGSETPAAISSNTNPFWAKPVGLGAFNLVNVVPNQYLEFDRNQYYVTPAHLSRIFVRMVPTAVAAAAVQSGELTFAQIGTADYLHLQGVKYLNLYRALSTSGIHMVVNLDKPYFKDPRVRQAMMYAINRAGIVSTVLHGLAETVNSFPFGPAWAVPKGLNKYPYNPAMAKQLLAAAGWNNSQSINIDIIPGTTDRDNVLNVVVGELRDVGFNANVRQVDPATLLNNRKDDSFDLSFSGTEIGTIDPDIGFVSLRCNAYYKDGAGTNFANYCNPKLNDLFLAAESAGTQAQRAKDYQQALPLENNDLPYIVLYVPDTLYAVNKALHGFVPNPDQTHAFWNASQWYLTKGT